MFVLKTLLWLTRNQKQPTGTRHKPKSQQARDLLWPPPLKIC